MSDDGFPVATATPSDLEEILALLTEAELSREGVAEHLWGFVVARDADGRPVGCAGLERYGALGLLRSVAVATDLQRSGLGSRLVSAVLHEAGSVGVRMSFARR